MRRGERKKWNQRQRHEVEACGGDKNWARTRERREVEVEVEVEERGGLDSYNERPWTTNKRCHVGV